jgi:hypothetical protein
MWRGLRLGCALLVACQDPLPAEEEDVDGGVRRDAGSTLQPAPIGGGFCCPRNETPSCGCFKNGGWVEVDDPSRCSGICDLAPPYETKVDEHGCEFVASPNSCLTPRPP